MFKNVAGKRFAEINRHLRHGKSAKRPQRRLRRLDLTRPDIFIEMGGATPGDRYHKHTVRDPGQQATITG